MAEKGQTVQGGFVMGKADVSDAPKKIKSITPVEAFLVLYNDHEGKEHVQIAYHVPGTESVSLLKQQIQGQSVATRATDWFTNQFLEHVKKGPKDKKVEQV